MELQDALDLGIPKDAISAIKSYCTDDKEFTGIQWATDDAQKKLKAVEMISSHFVDHGMVSFTSELVPEQDREHYPTWLVFGKKK